MGATIDVTCNHSTKKFKGKIHNKTNFKKIKKRKENLI